MWAISLLQAVRFTLRHTPEDKLKDTLGELLDIYEDLLEPEKIEYQKEVAQFLLDFKKTEADNGKSGR